MRFHACSTLLIASFLLLPFASAQTTVTADFGLRNLNVKRIPAGMFGINLASLQQPASLTQLREGGLMGTRKMAQIPVVYATTTPNWVPMDWYIRLVGGMHPLIVLTQTPPSLQPNPNPCGSGNANAPPTNVKTWAQLAASYVAHFDKVFPGYVIDYEIWNEPELQPSFCVADNTDATRLKTYLELYGAAAAAMREQAAKDNRTIRIGGPAISRLSLAQEWISALLSNAATAPYVDFVSYHAYLTGQTDIDAGMNWATLYSTTQSTTKGELYYYQKIYALVRAGSQPNPASTLIYATEYNDNWAFSQDCCRNHPTYAPLWNATAIADLLNSVYAGANAAPRLYHFAGSSTPYFCITGTWNASMNCATTNLYPYPQYYAFSLIASHSYLGLSAGGHMAASVSPINTQSGLLATAFYTATQDALVIVNPTGTNYSSVQVVAHNAGYATAKGTLFLLNSAHAKIAAQPLTLSPITGGFSASVSVPAYSTVGVSIAP